MGRFQLFIPSAVNATEETLTQCGCGDLIKHGKPIGTSIANGPGSLPGVICDWLGKDMLPKLSYLPDAQRWHPSPKQGDVPAGAYWVGWNLADPVNPADIAWKEQYDSEPAVLADGNEWLIPVAQLLPRRWGLNNDGEPARVVAPEFERFCRQAEGIYTFMVTVEPGAKIEVPAGWSYSCSALAFNYRINPFIISALGLLDDPSAIRLWQASLGYNAARAVEADLKKTESAAV